jgi:peptidoglycan/LPS O-acetylase OafA/YrhL
MHTAPSQRPEIHALTGIRAFAALWVVGFHLAYALPPSLAGVRWFARLGFLGVDLFFVLSGFIISYNYWPRFSKPSGQAYKRFLGLRLARLYPVHGATLLLSAMLMFGVQVADVSTRKDFSTWTATNFMTNVFLVHAWRPHYIESWNSASWSVSCEWFAYLIFPLLAFVRLQRLPALLGVSSAVVLVSFTAVLTQAHWDVSCAILIRVVCEFIAGCLIYHAYVRCKGREASTKGLRFATIALLIAFPVILWNRREMVADWAAVTFPLVILGIATSSGAISRVLGSKPAVYWGKVSYSLYMTHNVTLWPLKALAPINETTTILHRSVLLIVYLIAIGAVAALTYHLVEEPARKWLRRRMGHASSARSEGAPRCTDAVGIAP